MSRQPLFSEGDGEPVRISRTATGSAAMGAIATILFVSSGIVTASRFEQIFLALGVRIPHMSLWVLNPVVHVVIGALMLGICAWFLSDEWRGLAIGVWVVALLIYGMFVTAGLFLPLNVLVEAIAAP